MRPPCGQICMEHPTTIFPGEHPIEILLVHGCPSNIFCQNVHILCKKSCSILVYTHMANVNYYNTVCYYMHAKNAQRQVTLSN